MLLVLSSTFMGIEELFESLYFLNASSHVYVFHFCLNLLATKIILGCLFAGSFSKQQPGNHVFVHQNTIRSRRKDAILSKSFVAGHPSPGVKICLKLEPSNLDLEKS